MDTEYFQTTLRNYRARSADNRAVQDLPIGVLSQLLQDAQSLKQAALIENWITRPSCSA
jgi:hypothetical protein